MLVDSSNADDFYVDKVDADVSVCKQNVQQQHNRVARCGGRHGYETVAKLREAKLIYAALASTFVSQLIICSFLLAYSQWFTFIPLTAEIAAHLLAVVAIRRHSSRIFLVFVIYQTCIVAAMAGVVVWMWVVMEIKTNLSFFVKDCEGSRSWKSCEKLVRKEAGIAGMVVFVLLVLNAIILSSIIRRFYVFLRTTPALRQATGSVRRPPENIHPATMPSAPMESGSMGSPAVHFRPTVGPQQPVYTVYPPYAQPGAPYSSTPAQFPGTSTNPHDTFPQGIPEKSMGILNPPEQFGPPPPYL
ncbi:hypothetical protein Q1695_008450 [Nippostrongylus brasiliensis]|nr:hypothetical protein Q1695_008450 [Nippostrongylus brasiliensis]